MLRRKGGSGPVACFIYQRGGKGKNFYLIPQGKARGGTAEKGYLDFDGKGGPVEAVEEERQVS